MKKLIVIACGLFACGASYAQSSVTLYGLLNSGITYTNNEATPSGHGAAIQLLTGAAQGERWGLRGTEDLGGGLHSNFVLENGFESGNGTLGQGGLEFGRQAYVGLSGPWGAVTLGRQYDFIGDYMPAYAVGANTPAGLLAWSLPTNAAGGYVLDNRVWGDRVNNAVKYVSPSLSGFTFGSMYGFGNVAGSLGTNSTVGLVVNYALGAFSSSASYLSLHDVTTTANSTEYAGGAAYNLGQFRFFGMVSDVQLSSGTRARATTYEGGMTYLFQPTLYLGAGVQYQTRNNNLGSANQFTLTADYFLSKMTDVYLVGALAHDGAYGAVVQAAYGEPSSTSFQTAVSVGIRHKF